MPSNRLSEQFLVLLSAAMIVAGAALAVWALVNLPVGMQRTAPVAGAATERTDVTRADESVPAAPPVLRAAVASTAVPTAEPILLPVDRGDAPQSVVTALRNAQLAGGPQITDAVALGGSSAAIRFGVDEARGRPVHMVTFVAATRFDTIEPAIAGDALRSSWAGGVPTYTQVAVLSDTLPALVEIFGPAGAGVRGYGAMEEVVEAAWQDRTTLALAPFDLLEPRLVVLAVDGQNPVENANHFDPARYPYTATVYAEVTAGDAVQAAQAEAALAQLPVANRMAEQLTVLAMTGVTAMCRQTAAQMDRFGPAWPAEVVGPELSSADITHISNEVPFVEGCETNIAPDNFNFCSKPEYMATLTASGADIIGLTGNHQNDFGRENALKSIDMYDAAGLPLFGGGRDREAAFKPLIVEHNGNRLAFLGANSYGPRFAWATDELPGAAEFDLNIMSATIRALKEKDLADVVLAELQYQESYDVQPLFEQRQDFKALVRAGADIVTGVQSHVPQGMEFGGGGMILYGLGNLYFDQMWAQATREGMVVKHTFYDGRHISSQLLTTLLYDYGRPQWTTPAQRASLLERVFGASDWR